MPARIAGMSEDQPRPDLDVRYWAEIDLTEGVELSPDGVRLKTAAPALAGGSARASTRSRAGPLHGRAGL